MQTMLSVAEVAAQGEAVYDAKIKRDEETYRSQFALIEPESGDFEIAADEEAAALRLEARHPGRVFYVKKIGFAASEFVGGASA